MIQAVTGAYGYSGRSIARNLLDAGQEVRTLTNAQPAEDFFGGRVARFPLRFDDPDGLAHALEGVSVLYNTYWVRFNHRWFSFADAVRNTLTLFEAARRAAVRRIVHISITNPSEKSAFEYFRGKAQLEAALRASGISYGIVRPAVLFGGHDILVNNIAWAVRRLPVLGVFGSGTYRLRPIHVEDLATLVVRLGHSEENTIVNAVGPETFTFRGLFETVARILGKRRLIVSVPASLGYAATRGLGLLLNDTFLTRDEIAALMADLLYVDAPPAGDTRLSDWAAANAANLGRCYASELARRRRPRL